MATDNPAQMDFQALNARIATLERLLEVYEMTVLEQTDRLHTEIAGRRRAEQALQSSEANFRGLLEWAPDGMIIVNAGHEILVVNEQVERMFGYDREEILGRNIDILIPARFDHHREYVSAYISAPRRRVMGEMLDLYALRKDGSEFPVEISLSPLETPEGVVVSASVRDVTERNRTEKAVRQSEEKFRLIFNAANDPILLLDDSNRFIDCNQATLRILGAASKNEVICRHPAAFSPEFQPDGQASAVKAEQVIRSAFELGSMRFEWVHRRLDGTDFIVEVSLTVIPLNGRKVQLVHWRDITERQQATERIVRYSRELEQVNAEMKTLHEVSQAISRTLDMDQLLAEILNAMVKTEIFPSEIGGAIFLIEEGKIRQSSFVSLSGSTLEPCREIHWGKCLCGLALESHEIVVSPDTGRDGRTALCHQATKPHGRIIVPLEAVNKVVGLLSLYTQQGTEASEDLLGILSSLGSQIGIAINNAQLYQEAMNFSLHDPLTSLANRRFLEIQLEKSFKATRRYGEGLSLVMLDIDHFKVYNDTHGHPGGDRLLAKIALILRKEMRASDYVFRYGGEEFLVLFPGTGLREACNAAERLRAAIEAETGVTISLGVAVYREDIPDKEQLIARADAALYRAKQNGRNRVEVSD